MNREKWTAKDYIGCTLALLAVGVILLWAYEWAMYR